MEIQFFYNQSDDRQINKIIEPGPVLQGEFREESNLMNPSILIQSNEVFRYNYCYIEEFQRYYSISSVTVIRTGLYRVEMNVDVLMSFRHHLLNLSVIVDKQTEHFNGDPYIDDGSLISDNMVYAEIYNFLGGFNDAPQYILITAG